MKGLPAEEAHEAVGPGEGRLARHRGSVEQGRVAIRGDVQHWVDGVGGVGRLDAAAQRCERANCENKERRGVGYSCMVGETYRISTRPARWMSAM